MEDKKGAWSDKLPEALWAYKTTKQTPTGDTPFGFAFGNEAVVLVEIGLTSVWVQYYDPALNDEGLKLSFDLLEKRREKADMIMAAYQRRVSQYFNKRACPRKFEVGDWELLKVTIATKDPAECKLDPMWEGPYRVVGNYRPGANHLEDMEGKRLP